MKLLDRQLVTEVGWTSLAAVGLFTFVLMLGNAVKELLPFFLSGQLGFGTTARLLGLLAPAVAIYALPMGLLTGVLLVLGRMAADREITARRAAGQGLGSVAAPIVALALVAVAAGLLFNFLLMPRAVTLYERERHAAIRADPLRLIVPRTFIRDFHGLVLYAGEVRAGELRDFWLWELDPQGRVRRFARAAAGRVTYDDETNKLVLTLDQAIAEQRDEADPENFALVRGAAGWERATFDVPLGHFSRAGAATKLKWRTLPDLLAEWRRLGAAAPDGPETAVARAHQRMRIQLVLHEKAARAVSALSLALLAIPLGLQVSRRETSANLGVAVALAMAYYFGTVAVGWLDQHPEVRPDLLMWLPNLACQAVGLWLLRRVDRP